MYFVLFHFSIFLFSPVSFSGFHNNNNNNNNNNNKNKFQIIRHFFVEFINEFKNFQK